MKKPSAGGARPPFCVPPAKGYIGPIVEELLERRDSVCSGYLELLREDGVLLDEGCVIWLNHFERVASADREWIACGFILPPDLEDFINSEHEERLGHGRRPVTIDEVEDDAGERVAAYVWAEETLADPKWAPRFAPYIEDVTTNDQRAEELASRCWPKATKLTPISAHWFYREQLGGIPFTPLDKFLEEFHGAKYGGVHAVVFLDRWRTHFFDAENSGQPLHSGHFRKKMSMERQRFREAP